MDSKAWLALGAILAALALGRVVPWWIMLVFGASWLVYWQNVSRKQAQAQEAREQDLIAQEAPELAGMDFVTRAAFMLKAAEEFAANASPEARARFTYEVVKTQAAFKVENKVIPVWLVHVLLRSTEQEERVRQGQSDPSSPISSGPGSLQ